MFFIFLLEIKIDVYIFIHVNDIAMQMYWRRN